MNREDIGDMLKQEWKTGKKGWLKCKKVDRYKQNVILKCKEDLLTYKHLNY